MEITTLKMDLDSLQSHAVSPPFSVQQQLPFKQTVPAFVLCYCFREIFLLVSLIALIW